MVINYSHINKTNTCHLQSLRIEIQVLACSGMCGEIKPINEIPTLREKLDSNLLVINGFQPLVITGFQPHRDQWIPTPMDSNSLVINGFQPPRDKWIKTDIIKQRKKHTENARIIG